MDLKIKKEFEQLKNHNPALRECAYQELVALFSDPQNYVSAESKVLYLRQLCSENFLLYRVNDGVTADTGHYKWN